MEQCALQAVWKQGSNITFIKVGAALTSNSVAPSAASIRPHLCNSCMGDFVPLQLQHKPTNLLASSCELA